MALNELTIHAARTGLQAKQFSSTELVKACLARIKQTESKINALITVCEPSALREAKKADQNGYQPSVASRQPLAGIPLVIKDIFSTKGIKTTAGAKLLANYVPVYDATVVTRLKHAGAIILAKANLDAWAHGSSGENSEFGPTKNPWDLSRVPGGSSSGSAASVAADQCLAAMGTDTGGSVRLPASFCGVVGLKPTYGRVSRYGAIALASSLDSMGHLTKDVTDAALILQITAGPDGRDATMPDQPVPDYQKNLSPPLKNLTIGSLLPAKMAPPLKKIYQQALTVLAKQGAKMISVKLPHLDFAIAAYYLIMSSEVSANLARFDGTRFGADRQKFGAEAKRRIMLGTYALSAGYYDAYYRQALKVRTLIAQDFAQTFTKVDLIATPVSPELPFKLGEKTADPLKMYLSDLLTVPANLAGLPALSIPSGYVKQLPVGIQFLGPLFSEAKILQTAYHYEQQAPWQKKRPRL
ncbi:Asp-tRNA(Asn)/Glu-tRNA(Gln) amidotransferase GatCAB subunit A [Candidatus Shapirobacteria bacterium CG10_big_fil_rev_8_21_14_0_10_48_15]|uniref:Glutamyl-tRNA(Gln) amidotransferase subunit A n=1 Tax=Candidatus Shapirobacteria bacterium CG10_big_fil_rev_8_21_14_0_10_48_15 TaxID=1974484 RepID=A0A2M8L7P1_9BACT|nr:MAG: Asp-tRNA(Asn)/Glu-tRNA(Gln) amidotransferase GatCAB subunit A [Candidatus Shapirobacteria bacterium CG10_big_fil_rev_8_21_14_0_10_48_15]